MVLLAWLSLISAALAGPADKAVYSTTTTLSAIPGLLPEDAGGPLLLQGQVEQLINARASWVLFGGATVDGSRWTAGGQGRLTVLGSFDANVHLAGHVGWEQELGASAEAGGAGLAGAVAGAKLSTGAGLTGEVQAGAAADVLDGGALSPLVMLNVGWSF